MELSQIATVASVLVSVVSLAVAIITKLSSVQQAAFQNLSADYKRLYAEVEDLRQTLEEYEAGYAVLETQARCNGFSLAWRPGQDPDEALDEFLEANGLKLTEEAKDATRPSRF
jgi:hypothetical protein